MKLSTILLLIFLAVCMCSDDFTASCNKMRIGTVEDATDVMLEGAPTKSYKEYRHIKDEDDVEYKASDNQAKFYIHGVHLENIIDVQESVSETKLLTVTKNVEADGSDNKKFVLTLDFECTQGLSGVSDVYLTFTLDGNVCNNSIVGMRKKCGSSSAYAPIEISEVGWFSKTILTENGGQTVNEENIFDDTGIENVVAHKDVKSLTFRVKNMHTAGSGWDGDITMLPPFVRSKNKAEDVVYPVLRGAGARRHDLTPGQYEEFKLEFNCISMEKDSERVEVVFRPAYHTEYIFEVTKECEGLTLSNLIKKEIQDSIVFDFFAFIFFFLIFFTVLMGITVVYVKYKEYKGESVDLKESANYGWVALKNIFTGAADTIKGPSLPAERGNSDDESAEIKELKDDEEFDPNDVLNSGKKPKKPQEEDEFDREVKVSFDKDEENNPTHELKSMSKPKDSASAGVYGTI